MSKKLTQLNEDDLSTKSQATYYFDCTGDGKSKGSFCCILKKDTEYFILTAGHNIIESNNKVRDENKSTEEDKKGATYYLRNGSNNVELELIRDYRALTEIEKKENDNLKNAGKPLKYFKKDTAILKINRITEFGKINYCDKVYIKQREENPKKYYYKKNTNEFYDIETRLEVQGKDTDFKLITEKFDVIDTTSFYKNTIRELKQLDVNQKPPLKAEFKLKDCNIVGITSLNISNVNIEDLATYNEVVDIEPLKHESNPYLKLSKSGDGGDSGGIIFKDSQLVGIYLGKTSDNIKGRCRPVVSLNLSKEKYEII